MEKRISNFINIFRNYNEKIAYKYFVNENIVEKSYNDLADDVSAIKTFLLKNHGQRNNIALISESGYNWISICLGIYTSNNILVSIDYNISPKEINDILNYTETKIIFITKSQNERLKNELSSNMKIYIIDDIIDKIYKINTFLDCEINNEDLAQILFTSGTTNMRKGVMLSYKNIESAVFCDLSFNDSMMVSLLPMYHCFELFCGNIYRLYRGCTICINDNINNLMKNLQLFKPTYITIVPAMAKKFSDLIDQLGFETFDKMTGGNLRNISCGGASIDKKVIENLAKHNVMIYQGYGLTETASCCLTTKIEDNVMGSVGTPITNDIEVKVTDDGELLIKAPSVMMGYYKNEEATKEAIKDGWFYTGDLARIDETGNVHILGRKLNKIVLSNGKNIYPEELEEKFIGISNLVNVLIYDKKDRINALIQVEDNSEAKVKNILLLIDELNKELPGYKKISKIDFTTKQFPITTTKKIRRQVLIENLNEYITENKITKEDIYKKVKKILDIENDFKFNDNIYDLGFDSISTMELSCILEINAQDIYLNPTIDGIYELLNKNVEKIQEKENINKYISINKNIKKPFKENNVLLTGATGFLGAHILNEIADDFDEIYCLVRNKDKLKSIFDNYFDEELPGNVNIIIGDIEKEMFGLGEDEYFAYTRKINSVIHCAANVSHVADYEKMYKTNVTGTKNVIRFARQSNSIMHHMSTYSVSGYGLCNQTQNSIFDENILDINQKYEDNIYVRTKFEAEYEILKERREGLLVNIYRIGSLSWRKDGKFQINSSDNGLIKRINGLLKSNTVIENYENIKMDLTPVDECANAINLLINDNKINNIYHLYNKNLISLKDFIEEDSNIISKEEMKEKIVDVKDEDIKVYYYYNTLLDNNFNLELSCEKTSKKLNKLGFNWSKITKDYIFKLF